MADVVKWIKIVTDIFDDEKILLIESLPEADSILVIWFKLLCFAGKQNNSGVFVLNNKIPYTDEMFATIFRRPINTIRLALKTFEEFEMIEIINGAVVIPNWEKHQQLDKLELVRKQTRKRVEKHREKQKKLLNVTPCNVTETENKQLEIPTPNNDFGLSNELSNGNVTDNVTESNADRLDKDIDIDKDISIDIVNTSPELSIEPNAPPKQPKTKIDFDVYEKIYNTTCTKLPKVKKITEKRKTAIRNFLKEFTFEQFKEICKIANNLDFLIGNNKNGWKADFDFILRPDKALSILEGKYEGSFNSTPPTPTNYKEKYNTPNEGGFELD